MTRVCVLVAALAVVVALLVYVQAIAYMQVGYSKSLLNLST